MARVRYSSSRKGDCGACSRRRVILGCCKVRYLERNPLVLDITAVKEAARHRYQQSVRTRRGGKSQNHSPASPSVYPLRSAYHPAYSSYSAPASVTLARASVLPSSASTNQSRPYALRPPLLHPRSAPQCPSLYSSNTASFPRARRIGQACCSSRVRAWIPSPCLMLLLSGGSMIFFPFWYSRTR